MVVAISILLSVIAIFVTLMVSKEARGWLKNIIPIFSLIKHGKFLKEMEELGIKKVYKTRRKAETDNPIFSLHTSAPPQNIKIMGMSLGRIKNLGDEQLKNLLNQGCNFEFLLLNPHSPFMKQRAYQENPDLKRETTGFIFWIKKTFSSSEYKSQIKVWTYDLMPAMAIAIINDSLLFVNPYSLLRRNQEFPVIEIKKGGSLFKLYSDEYDKVRGHEHTKPIFP